MPVVPTIDTSALRELNKELAEIDVGLKRQVGKDIKTALKPFAAGIISGIPTQAPLSGMRNHKGRTAWAKPTIGVYGGTGTKGSIARLEIYGSGSKRAAFKIADLAGTVKNGDRIREEHQRAGGPGRRGATVRTHPTSSGDSLIRNLQSRYPLSAGGKGGRFAWAQFILKKPILIAEVVKILDKYADIVNRRVSGG